MEGLIYGLGRLGGIGLLLKNDDWATKNANLVWAMKKEWLWIGLM